MNRLLLPFLTLAAVLTAAAVISLGPGESGVLNCAGDQLVITQTSTISADYNCIAYTPTATATVQSTPTIAPTATIAATATLQPTATSTNIPPTATTTAPTGTFLDTFDGAPSSPLAWRSDNWDITVHSRDRETWYTLETMQAHHGPNCEPPMAMHTTNTYEGAVFQCANHVMTAIKAGGYGLIYLTPAYQVDFTNGTATIKFDMSTFRSSTRDWVDVVIAPMEDHLQLALDSWLPDLSGLPKRGVRIKMINKGSFAVEVINNHSVSSIGQYSWVDYQTFMTPSATTRSTFELQISKTHIKFGMPEHNMWWADKDIPELDWSVGVVQFGHHSYTPTKDFPQNCPNSTCVANTWHWDNISISPAVPFTMIKSDRRYTTASNGGVVNFASPAPSNANLRFAGIGVNMEVSFDNGVTWQAARVQVQSRHTEEAFWSYFTPIPEGTQSVRFRAQNWWGGGWMVKDLSIWK